MWYTSYLEGDNVMVKRKTKARKAAKPAKRKTKRKSKSKKKAGKKRGKKAKEKAKAKASHKAGKIMKKSAVNRAKSAKPSKKATLRVAKTASKKAVRTKAVTSKKLVAKAAKQRAGKLATKHRAVKTVKQAAKPTAMKKVGKTRSLTKPSRVKTSKVSISSTHFQPITNELIYKEILPYQETDNEEYMNPKQQAHFRQILLQRKQQFLQEMERTVHHLQDEAANFPDPNDRATQEEEFSLELRARDRERKFIKNIEEALQKIDEGEYGYCEGCGVEIGIRRLEARPTATLCIDCKMLDEIRERQMGG
jgi:DnaK suppressor protein